VQPDQLAIGAAFSGLGLYVFDSVLAVTICTMKLTIPKLEADCVIEDLLINTNGH
jgi:hypothetical protein